MSTKAQRRRTNFGRHRNHRGELVVGNTVRSTVARRYHNPREHNAPADRLNDNGELWQGWSRRSSRKPWPKPRRTWRTFLRDTGIDMWKRSEGTLSEGGAS